MSVGGPAMPSKGGTDLNRRHGMLRAHRNKRVNYQPRRYDLQQQGDSNQSPEMISGPSQSRCAPQEQASNAMGRGDSAGATSGNAEPGTNRDAMAGIEEIDSKLSDLVSTFREEQEGTRVAIRGLQRDAGLIDFNLCFLGSLLFIVGWLSHVNREFFTLLTWILPPLAIYQFHIKELIEKRRKMQAQMERGRICIEHVKLKLLGYVAPVIAGALFSINPEVGKMVSWALSPYAVYRVLGVSG